MNFQLQGGKQQEDEADVKERINNVDYNVVNECWQSGTCGTMKSFSMSKQNYL